MKVRFVSIVSAIVLLSTVSHHSLAQNEMMTVPPNVGDQVVEFVIFFASHRWPGGTQKVVPVDAGQVAVPNDFRPRYYCLLNGHYRGLKCAPRT